MTYLDMLTLLLVMLVIMLAMAGKGDAKQNEQTALEAAPLTAGEQVVALQSSASPIPSIVPVPTPATDVETEADEAVRSVADLALGEEVYGVPGIAQGAGCRQTCDSGSDDGDWSLAHDYLVCWCHQLH